MLVSLKAASLGLNLCVANNVFLMDPWWNRMCSSPPSPPCLFSSLILSSPLSPLLPSRNRTNSSITAAVELQAVSRVHRLGQTRPVTVHQLIVKVLLSSTFFLLLLLLLLSVCCFLLISLLFISLLICIN